MNVLRQRTGALLRATTVLCFAALAVGPVTQAHATEPGWPASHQPAADPGPADAATLAANGAGVSVPRGMTDAELRAKDPAGYRFVTAGRATLERSLLASVHARLWKAGVPVGSGRALSARELALAEETLATTAWSPYGYLKFRLARSTSPYARNGYLGTLYFTYGIYSAASDSYKWFTTSWPARSGNNLPADQSKAGVGPIPEYRWAFGFMYEQWRGYEADGRAEFSPGKWRLDPWTDGPYGRGYLEVHGGTGTHQFGATNGCIRMYPTHLSQLKVYYDTKMANKKDLATARLTVDY